MAEYRKYHPVDSSEVSRFCGIRSFMRLPQLQTTEGVDFGILGLPVDTGSTFRTGSRFAPAAIREMSMMLRAASVNLDIDIFKYVSGVDYGDVNVSPCDLQKAHKAIELGLRPIVEAGYLYSPIFNIGDKALSLGGNNTVEMGLKSNLQFGEFVVTRPRGPRTKWFDSN